MRATCGVMSARRPMHAAGQLVDQLEGLQVDVVPGAGQQRLEVLQQRRHHQFVAVADGSCRASGGAALRSCALRTAGRRRYFQAEAS